MTTEPEPVAATRIGKHRTVRSPSSPVSGSSSVVFLVE
jgi:hypothetical protein